MHQKEFGFLWKETMDTCFNLGNSKGAEYAHGQDRLDNFKRNAKETAVHPFTVWKIYAGKHWDSISTFIMDTQTGKVRKYSEPIQGRIHDMIVYLVLLKALLADEEVLKSKLDKEGAGSIGFTDAEKKMLRHVVSSVDKTAAGITPVESEEGAFDRLVDKEMASKLDQFMDSARKESGAESPTPRRPEVVDNPWVFLARMRSMLKNCITHPSQINGLILFFERHGECIFDGALQPETIKSWENRNSPKGGEYQAKVNPDILSAINPNQNIK